MDITANKQHFNTTNSDNNPDFEKNLSSQNIVALPARTRMSAVRPAPRQPQIADPVNAYGAVPAYRATPDDAFTYDITPDGKPVIMINDKQPAFAQNPAITMKNDLETFSMQLPEGESYNTMRSSADHVVKNVKKVMTVYPAPASSTRQRVEELTRAKSHLQETDKLQTKINKQETTQNLMRVDSKYNPARKGPPSLISQLAVKILSSSIGTIKARADYAKLDDQVILNAAFRNLGSKSEQSNRLADFLTTQRFTPEQKQDIVKALNKNIENDKQSFPNAPKFTVENFSAIKESLPALLNSTEHVTVENFVADLKKNLDQPAILDSFIQSATFDDFYKTATVNNERREFLDILHRAPAESRKNMYEDLANLTKPYRQPRKPV